MTAAESMGGDSRIRVPVALNSSLVKQVRKDEKVDTVTTYTTLALHMGELGLLDDTQYYRSSYDDGCVQSILGWPERHGDREKRTVFLAVNTNTSAHIAAQNERVLSMQAFLISFSDLSVASTTLKNATRDMRTQDSWHIPKGDSMGPFIKRLEQSDFISLEFYKPTDLVFEQSQQEGIYIMDHEARQSAAEKIMTILRRVSLFDRPDSYTFVPSLGTLGSE